MTERVSAIARVDHRTKNLIPRLKAGEIAVIDHRDMDGLSASGLVERGARAVINASPSISGRYPNGGPTILLAAGIPLVDVSDPELLKKIHDGQVVTINLNEAAEVDAERVRCGSKVFAGLLMTPGRLQQALEAARSVLNVELEAFARNTLEYIERERHLLFEPPHIPELRTVMVNRHVVVVVRGEGFKRDLEAILPYVRDVRPVLMAVDGAADALMEQGLMPDLIVGDMDSVSDTALKSGAEIVVHSYARPSTAADGAPVAAEASGPIQTPNETPGLKRLQDLKLTPSLFSVAGTSEDMAMLLAYEKGAELIVCVGSHFSMVDFLEKGRAGMASTFLVRLRVGSRLVDARGVGALYPTGPGPGYAWRLLTAAASIPVLAILVLSPGLRATLSLGYILMKHWFRHHWR